MKVKIKFYNEDSLGNESESKIVEIIAVDEDTIKDVVDTLPENEVFKYWAYEIQIEFLITDIEWDVDSREDNHQDYYELEANDLPTELTVMFPLDEVMEYESYDEYLTDNLADYLSDTYGFCVNFYEFDTID